MHPYHTKIRTNQSKNLCAITISQSHMKNACNYILAQSQILLYMQAPILHIHRTKYKYKRSRNHWIMIKRCKQEMSIMTILFVRALSPHSTSSMIQVLRKSVCAFLRNHSLDGRMETCPGKEPKIAFHILDKLHIESCAQLVTTNTNIQLTLICYVILSCPPLSG